MLITEETQVINDEPFPSEVNYVCMVVLVGLGFDEVGLVLIFYLC